MSTTNMTSSPIAHTMSLARAFTTRRSNKQPQHVTAHMPIGRAASQRAGRPVLRSKISAPVALTSTTNNLIDCVPDINGTKPIPRSVSSASKTSSTGSTSGEDSDASSVPADADMDTTDASSVDESPSPTEVAPNHLSCYFKPNVETTSPSASVSQLQRETAVNLGSNVPELPQRAPSHSKKAHERLFRKRSIQRVMSPASVSRASRELVHSSMDLAVPHIPSTLSHSQRSSLEIVEEATQEPQLELEQLDLHSPFDSELAQLAEVAEEFGYAVRDAEADAELVFLQTRGLACFDATDYADEIKDLVSGYVAEDEDSAPTAPWL